MRIEKGNVKNLKFKEVTIMSALINKDSFIGDIIKNHPQAKDVIQKYFGGGCFTCPGINMESLSFGAMMHNADVNKMVEEINKAINS